MFLIMQLLTLMVDLAIWTSNDSLLSQGPSTQENGHIGQKYMF